MKRLLLLILILPFLGYSQTVITLSTADTSKIQRTTGTTNAELVLKNGTRAISGFLYNFNNGTTRFRIPVLSTDVTGILPIANGGTGSATKNFVDLTTAQTIAGDKTLTGSLVFNPAGGGNNITFVRTTSASANYISYLTGAFASPTENWNVGQRPSTTNYSIYNNGTSSLALDVNYTTNVATFIAGVVAPTFTGALTGNASTATSAATLTNGRTIWGQSFNGSANVSGPLASVTTIGLSGLITSTIANNIILTAISSTTGSPYINIANTSGNLKFGVEDSGGSGTFTGSSAYAAIFGNASNLPAEIATNNTIRYSIAANGNHDFKSGTALFGGTVTVSGTSGALFTAGTLTNDFGSNHSMGVENGNGFLISKINTANNTNKLFNFIRDDSNGNSVALYKTDGTTVGLKLNGEYQGQTTLVTGTKAITITGVTTGSRAFVTLVSPSGASLTVQYQAVCTTNTLTIQANIGATTINVSDGSTLNYWVIN